ncbi:MAG: GNAT family N-acetyltransferase [Puia sp.]|nr:GNAT family N-acetyltransferase [Puia sp.]
MELQHDHTQRGGQFYLGSAEAPTAKLVYRMAGPHKMIIDHTEVSPDYRSQGVGRALVSAAVQYARSNGIKIKPICPYAKAIIDKTPEYQDVL